MFFVSIFAGFVPISDLGHMVSIGTLFAFSLVCGGVWLMRVKQPHIPRAFKTPLVPLVPIMGIVVCVYLMTSLPIEAWERLALWLIIGLAIYWFYGRKNTKIND
jgi:APA family basic amino acid/polyamine antiporter